MTGDTDVIRSAGVETEASRMPLPYAAVVIASALLLAGRPAGAQYLAAAGLRGTAAPTSSKPVLPDFLVFAPGTASGRARVAASETKAPSRNSAFGGIHVWRIRRDTIVLDFDGERTSTRYRLRGLPDSGRGVAIMAIHLSFGDGMGAVGLLTRIPRL